MDDLDAFRRRLCPRHDTVAQLDGYTGILSFGRGRLSRMEPREEPTGWVVAGTVGSLWAPGGALRLAAQAYGSQHTHLK